MTRFTLDALNPRMREQAAQKLLGMTYGDAKIAVAEKRIKVMLFPPADRVWTKFRPTPPPNASVSTVPLKFAEKRGNKFGAVRVESEYGKFDSKKEYRDYMDLRARETAGEIKDLRRQVRFSLYGPGGEHIAVYTADFVFLRDGKRVVADSKGHKTREWGRTKKLMQACHSIEVLEL